ncbi:MAG TPA: ParB/RepB/Spo0J family partition protein, partial [Plasticicumulans sp.]|nr:ParB/RepB/Spo0J family partition protein [Plasticicumulans sp.]
MSRRGSGGLKGLAGFLGSGEHQFGQSLMDESAAGVARLPVAQLVPGRFQPRRTIDEAWLAELADSVRRLGVIEPVAVRPLGEGRYEILAGEMRWRAAQQAGLVELPVIVHDVDDRTAASMALVENLLRRDLDPIEEAHALARLGSEFGLRNRELAELLSRSESAISRTLGLLALAPGVQALLQARRLDAGHARVLLGLPEADQEALAQTAVDLGLSVRELEKRRQRLLAGERPALAEPVV